MRVWEDLSRTKEERWEYETRLKQILDEQSMNRDRELLELEMEELKEEKAELEKEKEQLKVRKEEIKIKRKAEETKRKEEEDRKIEAEFALEESAKQIALKLLEQGVVTNAIKQAIGFTPKQLEIIQQELGNNDK